MIQMISKDFSFVGEHLIGKLYHLFESNHIKPNLTQNAAISFTAVLDDRADKIEKLAMEASAILDVQLIRDLSLLTIRHYEKDVVDMLTKDKHVLLRQQTPDTIQLLLSA